MTLRSAEQGSLRLDRFDHSRLVWALMLSLLLHAGGWGGYQLGRKYHLLERLHVPEWVKRLAHAFSKPKPEQKEQSTEREPPLMFVNVNPANATPEAPEKAKYYSALNAKAANPDAEKDTDTPKVSGKQEFVPETEDVTRNKFDKLQPTPPNPAPQPEERIKPKEAPGDLTMAKPETNPRPQPGTAEKERPRLLSQVDPSKTKRAPSQMMKQEGGVRRRLDSPSLDTKSTITGQYDWYFIEAVKTRWFDLLENREFSGANGHVQLRFKLHHDGRITDMAVLENTVSDTLMIVCRKAVEDPAPFEKWSKEMRLAIGKDYREITFTFIYY